MFCHLLSASSSCAVQALSIGVSDAIEFKLNPVVHEEHNHPDIARPCLRVREFKDYSSIHAALTGIICTWPLALGYISLAIASCVSNRFDIAKGLGQKFCGLSICAITSGVNILIPLATHALGIDKKHKYFGHTLLYLINVISFIELFAYSLV